MAGDRLSGWRVSCPACGVSYLLPAPYARAGARIRCPGCGVAFAAADPEVRRALEEILLAWAKAEPGGLDAVRAARQGGTFWHSHGASLSAALEPRGEDVPHDEPAALEAALARVLGPGARLL